MLYSHATPPDCEESLAISDVDPTTGLEGPRFLLARELFNLKFEPRDEIIHGLGRGEVATFVASTNVGKTTLIRNLLAAISVGRPFAPILSGRKERKVVLIDFEDGVAELKGDLQRITERFSRDEIEAFKDNFLLSTYPEMRNGTPVSLTELSHREAIYAELEKFAPDLIVIETVSKAFSIENENDNSEIVNKVMKPLQELARKLNAAVIISHHVGKYGESSNGKDHTHKGRGASAFGDQSKLIVTITKHTSPDCVLLKCAKTKGPKFKDTVLRLDRNERRFTSCSTEESISNVQALLGLFKNDSVLSKSEIVRQLSSKVSKSTVDRALKVGIEAGYLEKIRHGKYSLP